MYELLMSKLSELVIDAARVLIMGGLCVAPFYMVTLLPNPSEPTGLELSGSFFLGLLVRLILVFGGLHLLLRALVCFGKDDKLFEGFLSACAGCAMAIGLVYLG
jgi:hypothetical protein